MRAQSGHTSGRRKERQILPTSSSVCALAASRTSALMCFWALSVEVPRHTRPKLVIMGRK